MFRHAAARTLAVQAAKYFPAFGYCSAASRKNFSLMIRTHTICVHSPDLSTKNTNLHRSKCSRLNCVPLPHKLQAIEPLRIGTHHVESRRGAAAGPEGIVDIDPVARRHVGRG